MIFLFGLGWWCLRWSLATVLMLAVVGAAGYYVFNQAVAGDEHVPVPDVVNLPLNEASNVLAERGLELGKHSQMVSDQVPRYYVIAQRPAAGQVIRGGRKVHLTVSKGPEYVRAPDLRGQAVEAARERIERAHFQVGAVSRISHSAPRDTVLAQDPPLGKGVLSGGEIHLLVSDGPSFRMPDLVGRPLYEVVRVLAQLPVAAVPVRVDSAQAPVDVVLAQQPPPGSTLRGGQTVYYDVRSSKDVTLTQILRKVEVVYTLPDSPVKREVHIDVIDGDGIRETIFPREKDYVNGTPPRLSPGTRLYIPGTFRDELTVEVYLDGDLYRTYYYQGDAEPVITDYGNVAGREDSG